MPLSEWRGSDHEGYVVLPSFTEVSTDKQAYARAFSLHYREQDPFRGRPVAQVHPKTVIVQNPPAQPLTTGELDHIYELPYSRKQHPLYREPVPALEPVRFSVTSHRGCFGGCSFCALTHHQGRIVQSRSAGSIVREVEAITRMPGFTGIVQDVGGPTANMYGASCVSWNRTGACADRNCTTCNNLTTAHDYQVTLLRQLREIPGVKRVFISSGIRYDLFDTDPDGYLEEIVTSTRPGTSRSHRNILSRHITDLMNKPGKKSFEHFCQKFEALGKVSGKEQYILPVFYVRTSRVQDGRHGRACTVLTGPLAVYRTGTGLHPDPDEYLHLHVLHGPGPVYPETCICPERQGKTGAAGDVALPGQGETGPCQGRVDNGREDRSYRSRETMPGRTGIPGHPLQTRICKRALDPYPGMQGHPAGIQHRVPPPGEKRESNLYYSRPQVCGTSIPWLSHGAHRSSFSSIIR